MSLAIALPRAASFGRYDTLRPRRVADVRLHPAITAVIVRPAIGVGVSF